MSQRPGNRIGRVGSERERFERFIMREPNSGCWLWTGYVDAAGYGTLSSIRGGKKYTVKAPRLSFELEYGAIPVGLAVLHKCDTPACVRPDHLFLGTVNDNMQDMIRKGRHGRVKLTVQAAASIVADPREYRVIAEAFGIAKSTVSRIKAGHTSVYAAAFRKDGTTVPR